MDAPDELCAAPDDRPKLTSLHMPPSEALGPPLPGAFRRTIPECAFQGCQPRDPEADFALAPAEPHEPDSAGGTTAPAAAEPE